MKYRRTDIPSLLQGDIPDGEEVCYIRKVKCSCDFHHIMNGAYRAKSEKYGCWVWLARPVHSWLHGTPQGKKKERELKALCQRAFESKYSHELWMKEFKRNYL